MGIKVVVFDCGGVLLRNSEQSNAYHRWEERLDLPKGELAQRLYGGNAWQKAELGQITEEEFWPQACADLGLVDETEIEALRQDLWNSWQLDRQVLALVDRARQKHRVAILSNATTALEEMLEGRYGIADRFETIINSARVGVAKPDHAIYQELLRELDVKPHEVVFIDDRAENVAAAAAMGMHVIWFIGASELERQLEVYLRSKLGEPSDADNGDGHREVIAIEAPDSTSA